MDDRRVGLILRALRRRLGLRQVDVARAAAVSQATISRVERGHLDTLPLATIRRVFAVVDARFGADVRWRGGELDRLVDAGHAALGIAVARVAAAAGWLVHAEVTFQRYGERGSFDLLAYQPVARALACFELKTEVTSFEEMQRRFDIKRRLAPIVAGDRFGWRPRSTGAVLVVLDTTSNRARLSGLAPLVRSSLPSGTRQVRRWLLDPCTPLAGLWFVRLNHPRTGKWVTRGAHRVRSARATVS